MLAHELLLYIIINEVLKILMHSAHPCLVGNPCVKVLVSATSFWRS